MQQAMQMAAAVLVLAVVSLSAPVAIACGGESACQVDGGKYYVIKPNELDLEGGIPAIFYLHGHRGSALNAVRNTAFQKLASDLEVAFIAVQGVEGTWSFPTAPRNRRDEFTFFDRVLLDAEKRHGVDPVRTLLTGFSSGGFMTWYLACENPGRFAGYAPIAGAFWVPLPRECAAEPPFLFHVHGRTDTVVPLEGRALGGGRWHQGDVFDSFDIWVRQLGLENKGAKSSDERYGFECEYWAPQTGLLELCLHDGGHNLRTEWISRAWRKLAELRHWR
ncbi:alpha/beta hydrolase family esterase [Roseibium sp.]|uniref:alpha/beta hydrolase family esterase n=1 Tax=Roseibium sp. TaxID=1936156 RepID=UPI003A9771EB